MDRLEAMQALVMVADLKGFAPAARRLKVSPSAVTRLVAGLEEHLGTRLLQRTTRSVALTDAGARYLERARRILAEVEEAESLAHEGRVAPQGKFVVAAPQVFGRVHVAPMLGTYLVKYPDVVGELSLADRMVNLIEEGIDVAVRIGNLDDASHIARHVGATRRVVVASPRYLAKHNTPPSPHEISSHLVIQCSAINFIPEWRLFHQGQPLRIPFQPSFITNSVDAAIDHAINDGGMLVALSYQVYKAIHDGRLVLLFAKWEPPPLPIHIVYPSSRLLSANVKAFLDLVRTTSRWDFTNIGKNCST
jgi:DNA-binding transcriptional LysR family regulator